jgi:hypothetical protein
MSSPKHAVNYVHARACRKAGHFGVGSCDTVTPALAAINIPGIPRAILAECAHSVQALLTWRVNCVLASYCQCFTPLASVCVFDPAGGPTTSFAGRGCYS